MSYIKSQAKLHRNRPDLTGEHKFTDPGQLVLLIIFLTVWILDSFVFKYSSFLTENLHWCFYTVPGVIILFIALYLAWSGMKMVFGEVRENPGVFTEGVFSVVRHPIYLGAILSLLGMLILTLSILSFFIWLMVVIFYYYVSRFEEKLLLARFGKEYEDYIQKVPMLFPFRFLSTKKDDSNQKIPDKS